MKCKCPFFTIQVSEATTLEELQHSTVPIMDYIANAGCLRPLRSIADRDRLVEDLLMFQVVNRVRGPFERFVRTSEIYSPLDEYFESNKCI